MHYTVYDNVLSGILLVFYVLVTLDTTVILPLHSRISQSGLISSSSTQTSSYSSLPDCVGMEVPDAEMEEAVLETIEDAEMEGKNGKGSVELALPLPLGLAALTSETVVLGPAPDWRSAGMAP